MFGQIEHGPRSVKIIDERDKFDDPQPGTSRDEDTSDMFVEPGRLCLFENRVRQNSPSKINSENTGLFAFLFCLL